MAVTKSERIDQALAIAAQYGGIDGEHHKAWVIDQMVRALTGCPMVEATAKNCRGEPYTYLRRGESKEYQRFISEVTDGCESCGASGTEWDVGIPP